MDGFLLPQFSVSQDDDHVIVEVVCPEAIKGVKPFVAVEGCIFGFRLDPYYLPLVLPRPIHRAVIELIDAGRSRIVVRKQQSGETFEGLDQLQPCLLPEEQLKQAEADAEAGKDFFQVANSAESTNADTLPAPQGSSLMDQTEGRSLLQHAMSSRGLVPLNDDDDQIKLYAENEAESPRFPSTAATASRHGIGLNSAYYGSLLPAGTSDPHALLEVQEPALIHADERLRIAIAFEEERWDEGVYMENFLDQQEEIAYLLQFRPHLSLKDSSAQASSSEATSCSEARFETETLCVLVQLLFALCYDNRTNEGEPTVESGWNIIKMCRCLTASVRVADNALLKENLTATLIGCIRRSLTVPLYRHWQLAMTCLAEDTVQCLLMGSAYVRACLHDVRQRLEENQDAVRIVLARIWVTPLLDALPDNTRLQTLAETIKEIIDNGSLAKNTVGGDKWDLEVLEVAAQQALDDGEGGFV